jgi:translation elongation factor EF-1beta
MTNGGKIINVIFDLAVPFEEDVDFKQLEKEVKEKIKTINANCNAVVTVEHSL